MYFPISDAHISPIYLALVGFLIGILGGFFGVGGSFIAGPALRAVGLDWNFAVGTDLAHIVGKSVVAAKRHRALGNVDLRLGLIMACGTIGGAELGAQVIQILKRAGNVNLVVSVVSIAVYVGISAFMIWESQKTMRAQASRGQEKTARKDVSAFSPVTRSIQGFHLWPMIKLPVSGVRISLWIILLVGLVGGGGPSPGDAASLCMHVADRLLHQHGEVFAGCDCSLELGRATRPELRRVEGIDGCGRDLQRARAATPGLQLLSPRGSICAACWRRFR